MLVVINSALYRSGKRGRDLSVEAISDVLHMPGLFVWFGLHELDNAMLDPYGAQHPAEFSMMASEVFFVEPVVLLEAPPSLYVLLQAFYLQDSARHVLGSEQRQEGSLPRKFARRFIQRCSAAA